MWRSGNSRLRKTQQEYLMKKTLVMFAAALALAMLSLPVSAQDAPGGYKIGVVDMQKVMAEYDKREAKYKELEVKVKELQAPIDALSAKITQMKADYDKRAAEANADRVALAQLEGQVRAEHATYEAKLRESQVQIDELERAVLTSVLDDIKAALKEIGEQQNYHLILNGREGSGSAVVYHSTSIDLTSQLLAKLNGSR